jgi:hypothetical protein
VISSCKYCHRVPCIEGNYSAFMPAERILPQGPRNLLPLFTERAGVGKGYDLIYNTTRYVSFVSVSLMNSVRKKSGEKINVQ